MSDSSIETILPLVQKPARYIGGETNIVYKTADRCTLSFALAFPDVYEVGMSHLGLRILHGILNSRPRWRAERVYAPWPDMEERLRTRRIPLSSLESETPLHRFDVVGFSLQYELSCTNVLAMLNLGRIPIKAAERKEEHPLVVAGGPCATNPEPLSPFFDAFVIGEGEEVIVDIARSVEEGKARGLKRRDLLERLSGIEGIYAPAFHDNTPVVHRRVMSDLDKAFVPSRSIVPLIRTIHDRITLEIARGCTRGCRFCQAGMVWRPYRERDPGLIMRQAEQALQATGYDEVSLLSLSAGDHSCIGSLIRNMMNRYADRHISLALPSLRTETLTEDLIDQIKRVRKTSFTLAPEAGTQRLRNVINKGNREEDLLHTVRSVFEAGWRSIKLYFMIGLPTERKEDLEGIVDLAFRVLHKGENRRRVTVSLSTFVPKPHTPFQWERQIDLEETEDRQRYFKDSLRHGNLNLKWHDPRMSFLEGSISRGDANLAPVIERVYELGARFDGWSDLFHFELWERAFKERGIDPLPFLERRDTASNLPWDYVDVGVNKAFLLDELHRSRQEKTTEDCRVSDCVACGACGGDVMIREASPMNDSGGHADPLEPSLSFDPKEVRQLRLHYKKTGKSRFLSHLDTASALIRAIARSGLHFEYSKGFHPNPKISFPCATALGIESESEYADIWIRTRDEKEVATLKETINDSLPEGMAVLSVNAVREHEKKLSKLILGFVYEMYIDSLDDDRRKEIKERVGTFMNSPSFIVEKALEGKSGTRDLRPPVKSLVCNDKGFIRGVFLFSEKGGVRPVDIITEVLGMTKDEARTVRIVKKQTLLATTVPE